MSALVRREALARTTGTVVLIIDADHPDAWVDRDGGRWVTVCDGPPRGEPHGGVINHETLALARAWAAHPEEWCETCMAAWEAKRNLECLGVPA